MTRPPASARDARGRAADKQPAAAPPPDRRPTGRPRPPATGTTPTTRHRHDRATRPTGTTQTTRRTGRRGAGGGRRTGVLGGSARGEARRRDLLDRVADDLAANGLVDFSLRRAARAAGTTHKVLLYYFDGADDLLAQAILKLRDRRIDRGLAAAARRPDRPLSAGSATSGRRSSPRRATSSTRPSACPCTTRPGTPRSATAPPSSTSRPCCRCCRTIWSERRRLEVAELILGALRGFLIDRLTSGNTDGVEAGLDALARALDREEAAGPSAEPRQM